MSIQQRRLINFVLHNAFLNDLQRIGANRWGISSRAAIIALLIWEHGQRHPEDVPNSDAARLIAEAGVTTPDEFLKKFFFRGREPGKKKKKS